MSEYSNIKDKIFVIADDEDLLREVLILELGDLGAICLEATNGLEAFEHIKTNKVDFLLSDVRMPNSSGIELLNLIKNSEYANAFPILLMSGYTDLTKEQATELGAITIVAKPFSISSILPQINDALK